MIPNRLERTIDLAHTPDAVWQALTTKEGLGGWFGSSAEIDLRPGGEAQIRWEQYDAEGTLLIQVVEAPRVFAYTWAIEGLPADDPRRTYVEFTLEPSAGGTRLTVVESGFAQVPADLRQKSYDGNSEGWRLELGELVDYLDAAA